jgi:hypothetical protein
VEGQAWVLRAKGWIKTMNWDAVFSMIVYSSLTIAFYILGAAILNPQNLAPEGMEMITILSQMYTKVLGMGAFYIFLFGAFFALFSTLFVGIAANARLYADFFRLAGVPSLDKYLIRQNWIRGFIVFQAVLSYLLFMTFKLPLWMVVIGGTAQTLLMPAIVYAAFILRFKKLDKELCPSKSFDIFLVLCCVVIVFIAVYGLLVKLL